MYPALSGKHFKSTLKANVVANIVRNLWSHAIIFCGHFPDQAFMFTEDEVEDETRGGWYVRQLLGAANIDGGPLFHVMAATCPSRSSTTCIPDMPSSRYQQIAPRVKEICEKYGLPYNTGPLRKQWGTVQRTIVRLAFPGGKARPKPGPYVAPPKTRGAREGARSGVPVTAGSDRPCHGDQHRVAVVSGSNSVLIKLCRGESRHGEAGLRGPARRTRSHRAC